MNASRHLGVTDIDQILNWTPREFQLLMKGAQHQQIDDYEYLAKLSMAIGYASRAKRPSEKKIFNAKRERQKLETGKAMSDAEMNRIKAMNQAIQGFDPKSKFIPKK